MKILKIITFTSVILFSCLTILTLAMAIFNWLLLENLYDVLPEILRYKGGQITLQELSPRARYEISFFANAQEFQNYLVGTRSWLGSLIKMVVFLLCCLLSSLLVYWKKVKDSA